MSNLNIHDVFNGFARLHVFKIPTKDIAPNGLWYKILVMTITILACIPNILFLKFWRDSVNGENCQTESIALLFFIIPGTIWEMYTIGCYNSQEKIILYSVLTKFNNINHMIEIKFKTMISLRIFKQTVNWIAVIMIVLIILLLFGTISREGIVGKTNAHLQILYVCSNITHLFTMVWILLALSIRNILISLVAVQLLKIKTLDQKSSKAYRFIHIRAIDLMKTVNVIFERSILSIIYYVFELMVTILWGMSYPGDSCVMKRYPVILIGYFIIVVIILEVGVLTTNAVRILTHFIDKLAV